MEKRFIILVDFSEYSANLIKYACDWSKQVNAEFLLVHQTVVLTPAFSDIESRATIARHSNDEALKKLKEFATDLVPSGVKVTYSVSDTHLQLTLPNLLAGPFENLIFVGLKGTELLKKIFIGSVALQVIDYTKSIVVAMPKEISHFSHEKLFVAVTEEPALNIPELNNYLNFIDKSKTSITFFYLAMPNENTVGVEKQLKGMVNLFGDRFETSYAVYEGGNAFTDIKKVINNRIDEILIVQKGSHLLTDRLFRKFLINELVYEGQTPLIVLPKSTTPQSEVDDLVKTIKKGRWDKTKQLLH